MKFVADLRTLLIALWLGAAIFFSFAVAPSVFSVLPTRELAGSVINRTLAIINYSGFIIGITLLLTSYVSSKVVNRVKLWLEQGLLLILTAACAFGQFVIGARLSAIRTRLGRPIDEVAAEDPLRIAFNDLHGYSVTVLSVALICALIAFFLLANRARQS